MRPDTVGFFWDDTPPPKVLKEKQKRTPPEPVWESADYLPGLAEAQAFAVDLFTDAELLAAQRAGEHMLFDVEVYPNYFLVSFMSFTSGKVVYFEMDDTFALDLQKLHWVVTSFCLVGFNSKAYDMVIVALALAGYECDVLQRATFEIIMNNERGDELLKMWKVKAPKVNHIDLIEVAPLRANLKIYGGRLHTPSMADLPFKPGTELSQPQKDIVRWYNIKKDLVSTAFMYKGLWEQIKLRERLGADYGTDLRSKSDAQIAEAVIGAQVSRLNGQRVTRPEMQYDVSFHYQPPAFLQYATPLLRDTLRTVCESPFFVDNDTGAVGLPEAIKELKLNIGTSAYQMGVGGLHSQEQKAIYYSTDTHTIYDRDVTSYYPQLILNSGMFPKHLGPNFLRVYQRIVSQRVAAKAAGDKVTADSLKITANGTFGKLGSPWSVLYSPDLLIQVTVTGQLSLLMLIERLELAGIPVVSANTDGIVMNCPNHLKATYLAVIAQWEQDTGLTTEESVYAAIYSRDVNNYIAVKPDGTVKAKGAYSNPWGDPKLAIFRFHKNPVNIICTEAVEAYLTKGTPCIATIRSCDDVRKFITVRTVKGGGVYMQKEQPPVYLGKSVRWYYAQDVESEIVYAASGNKVARSDGTRPIMDLPNSLPGDIDYDWYEAEAHSMLSALGLPAFEERSNESPP